MRIAFTSNVSPNVKDLTECKTIIIAPYSTRYEACTVTDEHKNQPARTGSTRQTFLQHPHSCDRSAPACLSSRNEHDIQYIRFFFV